MLCVLDAVIAEPKRSSLCAGILQSAAEPLCVLDAVIAERSSVCAGMPQSAAGPLCVLDAVIAERCSVCAGVSQSAGAPQCVFDLDAVNGVGEHSSVWADVPQSARSKHNDPEPRRETHRLPRGKERSANA